MNGALPVIQLFSAVIHCFRKKTPTYFFSYIFLGNVQIYTKFLGNV